MIKANSTNMLKVLLHYQYSSVPCNNIITSKYTKLGKGDRHKSNPKSSAYNFTLNDVLRKCKSHKKVQFYLFWHTSSLIELIGETGPKLVPNTANHGQGDTTNLLKSLTHHFTSSEALFKCNDHLRVESNLFQDIWGISEIWGNWTQIGPRYLKSWLGGHSKSLKAFNSSFQIK